MANTADILLRLLGDNSSAIKALNETIAAEKNQLNQINTNIAGLKNQNQAVQNQINTLAAQKQAISTNITSLQAQKAAITGTTDADKAQRKAIQDNINALSAQRSGINNNINSLNSQRQAIQGNISSLNTQSQAIQGNINALNQQVSSLEKSKQGMSGSTVAVAAMGAAFLKLGQIVTSVAIEFDKTLRNVNSLVQLSEKDFFKLGDSVRELGKDKSIIDGPVGLAKGMYELVSSGFDVAKSLQMAGVASKAASAGLTTTQTSVSALAALMNAYNQKTLKDSTKFSDQLFKVVDKGVVSFEALSNNLGSMVATAAAAKIPFETLGAAVIELTRAGISMPEAETAINGLMRSIIDAGPEARAEAVKLGLDLNSSFSAVALETRGLGAVMQDLYNATGGATELMAKLIPESRATKAALTLGKDGAEGFTRALNEMGEAAGSTEKALSQQSKSYSFQIQKMKAGLEDLKIEFGTIIAKGFTPLLDNINETIRYFKNLDDSTKKNIIGFGVLIVGLGSAALSVKALVFTFAPLISGLALWGARLIGLAGSFGGVITAMRVLLALIGVPMGAAATALFAPIIMSAGLAAAAIWSIKTIWDKVFNYIELKRLQGINREEAKDKKKLTENSKDTIFRLSDKEREAKKEYDEVLSKENLAKKLNENKDLLISFAKSTGKTIAEVQQKFKLTAGELEIKKGKGLLNATDLKELAVAYAQHSTTVDNIDRQKHLMDKASAYGKLAVAKSNEEAIAATNKKAAAENLKETRRNQVAELTIMDELKKEKLKSISDEYTKKKAEADEWQKTQLQNIYLTLKDETAITRAKAEVNDIYNQKMIAANKIKSEENKKIAKESLETQINDLQSQYSKIEARTDLNDAQKLAKLKGVLIAESNLYKAYGSRNKYKDFDSKDKSEFNEKGNEALSKAAKLQKEADHKADIQRFKEIDTEAKKGIAEQNQAFKKGKSEEIAAEKLFNSIQKDIEKGRKESQNEIKKNIDEKIKKEKEELAEYKKNHKEKIDLLDDLLKKNIEVSENTYTETKNSINNDISENESLFFRKKISSEKYNKNYLANIDTQILAEQERIKDLNDLDKDYFTKKTTSENNIFKLTLDRLDKEYDIEKRFQDNLTNSIASSLSSLGSSLQGSSNQFVNELGQLSSFVSTTLNKISTAKETTEAAIGAAVTETVESINRFIVSSEKQNTALDKVSKAVTQFGADSQQAKDAVLEANEGISDSISALPGIIGEPLGKLTRMFTDFIGVTKSAATSAKEALAKADLKELIDKTLEYGNQVIDNYKTLEQLNIDNLADERDRKLAQLNFDINLVNMSNDIENIKIAKIKKLRLDFNDWENDNNDKIIKESKETNDKLAADKKASLKSIQDINEKNYKSELSIIDKVYGEKRRKLESSVQTEIDIIQSKNDRLADIENNRNQDQASKQERLKAFNSAMSGSNRTADFYRANETDFETGFNGNSNERNRVEADYEAGLINYETYAKKRTELGLKQFQYYTNQSKLIADPKAKQDALDKATQGQKEFYDFIFDKEKEKVNIETAQAEKRLVSKRIELTKITDLEKAEIAKLDQAYKDSSGYYKDTFVNATQIWVKFAQDSINNIDLSNLIGKVKNDIAQAKIEYDALDKAMGNVKTFTGSSTETGKTKSNAEIVASLPLNSNGGYKENDPRFIGPQRPPTNATPATTKPSLISSLTDLIKTGSNKATSFTSDLAGLISNGSKQALASIAPAKVEMSDNQKRSKLIELLVQNKGFGYGIDQYIGFDLNRLENEAIRLGIDIPRYEGGGVVDRLGLIGDRKKPEAVYNLGQMKELYNGVNKMMGVANSPNYNNSSKTVVIGSPNFYISGMDLSNMEEVKKVVNSSMNQLRIEINKS